VNSLPPRRERRCGWTCLALALAGLACGGYGAAGQARATERGRGQATGAELAQLQADLPDLHALSRAFNTVAKAARPGVVHIKVSGGEAPRVDPEERERLREKLKEAIPDEQLDRMLRRVPPGSGSGIIIDTGGYILTNNHVVEGRDEIRVVLNDEREFPATVIGTDRKTDLAVIKVEATDLPALKLGDSDQLDVGDWVIAVGAPFGLTQTVTHGIVSAKGRKRIPGVDIDYQDFIQTDAAINPGNSGGPLLNLRGEVIGVNTAIATQGEGVNAGVAFTIPSNLAAKIAAQLKATGNVQRGWLGVSFVSVNKDDADIFGLPKPKGVLIERVLPQSPADRAGLQVEDAITAIDDTEVDDLDHVRSLIADVRPDERVRLHVIRDRKPQTITVRLGLQPEDTRSQARTRGTDARDITRLGLQVRTMRPDLAREMRSYDVSARGVLVMGLMPDRENPPDIAPRELVIECNGQPVQSVTDLQQALSKVPSNRNVKLTVLEPTGDKREITVKPARKK
jgi:serine protease Do